MDIEKKVKGGTGGIVERILKKNVGSEIKVHLYDDGLTACLFWESDYNQWFVYYLPSEIANITGGYFSSKANEGLIYRGSSFEEALRHLTLKKED